jgi:pimeloyl-ACP methyl ester carboxylesterase
LIDLPGAGDSRFTRADLIDLAREMVAGFPRARLHVVPNAKLCVHEEYPEEVARVILPTLLGRAA